MQGNVIPGPWVSPAQAALNNFHPPEPIHFEWTEEFSAVDIVKNHDICAVFAKLATKPLTTLEVINKIENVLNEEWQTSILKKDGLDRGIVYALNLIHSITRGGLV